jgi:hypothetical protein
MQARLRTALHHHHHHHHHHQIIIISVFALPCICCGSSAKLIKRNVVDHRLRP